MEREVLALVWAHERFNMYTFGWNFELETDHKLLEYLSTFTEIKPFHSCGTVGSLLTSL